MSGALDDGGLVGAHEAVGGGFGKGALQQSVAKSLGRLRQYDELAGNGGCDQGAVGGAFDLLDGIDGGKADDGGAMFDDRVDGAVDGGGIDERSDRIVD